MKRHYYQFLMFDGEEELEITMKIPGDLTAGDLLKKFEYFMLSVGYHPETVKNIFEEIKND